MVAWGIAVSGGSVGLWIHASRPGVAGDPPLAWPAESRIARTGDRANLVMLAHPFCACTRASLSELSILMNRLHGQLSAHVVFIHPKGEPEAWERGDLWRAASAIPGVTVAADDNGAEAARFRVSTSGDTVVYDAAGRLVFHGGITSARGHVGDNVGVDRIVGAVTVGEPERPDSPVFGCSLWDPQPASERR